MEKRKPRQGMSPAAMIFKGAFVFNSVLTQAIGICPIVAVAYTVKASALLSLTLVVLLLLNEFLAAFVLRPLPRWMRVVCYLAFSTGILTAVTPALDRLTPQASSALGIYLPLLAVNSLVVIRCEKFAVKKHADSTRAQTALYCLIDSVSSGVGYAAVILLTAFIRSQLIAGKFLGLGEGTLPKLAAMSMPFGGLIVLAFIAAVHKAAVSRFFPEEPTDVFDFTSALKMPLVYDPGIRAREEKGSLIREPFTEKDTLRRKGTKITKKQTALHAPGSSFEDPFSEYIPDESEYVIRKGLDFTDDDVDFLAVPIEEEPDEEPTEEQEETT